MFWITSWRDLLGFFLSLNGQLLLPLACFSLTSINYSGSSIGGMFTYAQMDKLNDIIDMRCSCHDCPMVQVNLFLRAKKWFSITQCGIVRVKEKLGDIAFCIVCLAHAMRPHATCTRPRGA